MRKFILLVIIFSKAVLLFSQTTAEKLNRYLTAAQQAGVFNGSVMIVQGGKVLVENGYGFKEADTKSSDDINTIYQVGSVTKQFTSATILRLAEQGKLSLSDKLNKYFPGFPNADRITIENLLTHTSGIYNYTRDTAFMGHNDKPTTQQTIMDLFKNKPLDFEPGSKYSYSNSGYMLLGYIIENVTGKKYELVIRELIFTPLNMTHSGFDFTHLQSIDKATGYYAIAGTSATKSKIVDSSVSFAAGAIYSTAGDMYKWNQSLSTEKILRKSSLENAFKPRLSKYGLGLVADTIAGRRIIAHDGGISGFLSYNAIVPKDNISITILSNSNSSKVAQVSKDVLSILYNKPYTVPEVVQEISMDAAILQHYVGEYELSPAFRIAITLVGGSLKAQATGQTMFDLFAKSETVFFLKVVDAQVEFVKDEKGEVERLVLHQNGLHQPARKIK